MKMDKETLDFFIRFEQLEKTVQELEKLLRFYCPEAIPIKYRKAFPGQFEDKFFRAGPFKKALPDVHFSGSHQPFTPSELDLPKDPAIYKAQIAKMNSWQTGENAKRIAEINKEAKENAKIIQEIEKNSST